MNDELSAVLNFSAEDLEANRAGKMSTAQVERLRGQFRRSLLIGLVAMFVMALVATTFLFFGSEQNATILTLVGIGVTVLNAVMMGMFLRHWLRLNADARDATVMSQCGETNFTVRVVGPRTALYLVRVESQNGTSEMDVSREAFEILRRHKGECCFYRAPHTGTLLAAEAG